MGSTVKLANDLYLETSSIVHKQGSQITPLDTYLDTIIESGSNDNGEYVKFYDGTMICRAKKSFSNISMIAYGGLYRCVSISFSDFPIAFIEPPYVSYSLIECNNNNSGALISQLYMPSVSSAGNVCIIKENNTAITGVIGYVAVGKWK